MTFHLDSIDNNVFDVIENMNALVNREKLIKVSDDTPDILKFYGFNNYPVYFPLSKLSKSVHMSHKKQHGHAGDITKKSLRKAIIHLSNPLIVSQDTESLGLYINILSNSSRPIFICLKQNHKTKQTIICAVYSKMPIYKYIKYIDNTIVDNLDIKQWSMKIIKPKLKDLIYLDNVDTKTKIMQNSL